VNPWVIDRLLDKAFIVELSEADNKIEELKF
jgi:hypothetical protein